MSTQQAIDDFLGQHKLAVAGVSRSGKGFGHYAWRALLKKGYQALPVNPHVSEIDGLPCYRRLADLPKDVGGLLVVVSPSESEGIVRDAVASGIRRIWLQQGSASPAALRFCAEAGIDVISGECIMMFAAPGGIHKLHGWIWDKLGKLPA
jgi:uncharacterized protein